MCRGVKQCARDGGGEKDRKSLIHIINLDNWKPDSSLIDVGLVRYVAGPLYKGNSGFELLAYTVTFGKLMEIVETGNI